MAESTFNRPTPVQEQQAALKAEPTPLVPVDPEAAAMLREQLNAQNPLAEMAHRDVTDADLRRIMGHELPTSGVRYEGELLGNPVVSDPTMPPGVVGAVRLTAEQLEATRHLKPGEAWRNAMVKDMADATAGKSENLAGTLEPIRVIEPECPPQACDTSDAGMDKITEAAVKRADRRPRKAAKAPKASRKK